MVSSTPKDFRLFMKENLMVMYCNLCLKGSKIENQIGLLLMTFCYVCTKNLEEKDGQTRVRRSVSA